METPSYIKSLLIPNGKKPTGRRVWSIDLETVWLPFFTATNTMGDTHIAPDALGAPLRLNYNQDGSVKFSKSGRPVIAVSKEIAQNVRLVRENFVAGLQDYANAVVTENPDGYKAMVEMAGKAGEPILVTDRRNLDKAMLERMEEAIAEAEANAEAHDKTEADTDKPKSKGKVAVPA